MLHHSRVCIATLRSFARGLGKIACASLPHLNLLKTHQSCARHEPFVSSTCARTGVCSNYAARASRSYMKQGTSALDKPPRADSISCSSSCTAAPSVSPPCPSVASSTSSLALRRSPPPRPLSPQLIESLSHNSCAKHREFHYKTVPSTRAARAANFTSLFFQVGWDKLRHSSGSSASQSGGSFLSLRSHERIAQTLCRMRGAVLKLGQMVSIQDARTMPPAVMKLFERARDGAYAMPFAQLEKTLAAEWNEPAWRTRYFAEFDQSPTAAASIGQVHYARLLSPMCGAEVANATVNHDTTTTSKTLTEEEAIATKRVPKVSIVASEEAHAEPTLDSVLNSSASQSSHDPMGQIAITATHVEDVADCTDSMYPIHSAEIVEVAVKVQYPGVACSIDADVANLRTLMSLGVAPAGMFVDTILTELQQELKRECRYTLEAAHQTRYRALLLRDKSLSELFHVPMVLPHLSTDAVLTTEFVRGVPLDKLAPPFSCQQQSSSTDTNRMAVPQNLLNYLAEKLMQLTLTELFSWHFMQTDPNYANFLYDAAEHRVHLLDFGAAREYEAGFVRHYIDVVAAAARRDRETIVEKSIELGFLTGDEVPEMIDAHVQSVLLLGKPFSCRERPFDFARENLPEQIKSHVPTMIRLRLRPPPTPVYSLHRRLSGTILLATRYKASIFSGELFWDLYERLSRPAVA